MLTDLERAIIRKSILVAINDTELDSPLDAEGLMAYLEHEIERTVYLFGVDAALTGSLKEKLKISGEIDVLDFLDELLSEGLIKLKTVYVLGDE